MARTQWEEKQAKKARTTREQPVQLTRANIAEVQEQVAGPAPDSQHTAIDSGQLQEQQTGHAPDLLRTPGAVTPRPGLAPAARKLLHATPSIDGDDARMMAAEQSQKMLHASDLREMAGLEQLAAEHLQNFSSLLHNVRLAGPNRKLIIGSACTGSAGHHVIMIAFLRACAKYLPDFTFEIAFDCENANLKRKWITDLYRVLPAPGADSNFCMYDNICDLGNAEATCHNHRCAKGKAKKCRVRRCNVIICSTSCVDLSAANMNKATTAIFEGEPVPGNKSRETLDGLCNYMKSYRPDVVFWENVCEAEKEIHMAPLKTRLLSLGYDCQFAHINSKMFGLPHNRNRVFGVFVNITDPEVVNLKDNPIDAAFRHFRLFLRITHRKFECASHFLLDAKDPCVTQEYVRIKHNKESNQKDSYDWKKAQSIADKKGLPFRTWHPPAAPLAANRWFQALTRLQQHAIQFNLKETESKPHHMFRNSTDSFGRIRVSPVPDEGEPYTCGSCMPDQRLLYFGLPDTPYDNDDLPRVVLGRENLAMQGFPISIIKAMPNEHTEATMADLAGNMVSLPVLMGVMMSAFAALSWVPKPSTPDTTVITASAPGPAASKDKDADEQLPQKECAEGSGKEKNKNAHASLDDWEASLETDLEVAPRSDMAQSSEGLMHAGPKRIPGMLSVVYSPGNAEEYIREMRLTPSSLPGTGSTGS